MTNHKYYQKEEKKAILLTIKKISYRNGTLVFKLFHELLDNNMGLISHPKQDLLINCTDIKVKSDNYKEDICVNILYSDGEKYIATISNSKMSGTPPVFPFKFYVSAFLFDNQMQYFSLPLNFRGKRTNK